MPAPRTSRPRRGVPPRWVAAVAVVGTLLVAACGDDDGGVADRRADQVRAAGREAGLPHEVVDVLALAARGPLATFQVTYAGTAGAEVTVSQAPPDQRVDVLASGTVVESRVLRDGIAYRCDLDDAGQLACERAAGGVEVPGAFTDEALEEFTHRLGESVDAVTLTVERRTIAGTDATCLVSAPKAGTPLDASAPPTDSLCLSPEGAQLLLDAGGERLVADRYTTDVPDETFDI